MKHLTKKQIAEQILRVTDEYTERYFENFPEAKTGKGFDKQLWASLHVGFFTGMKLNGYTDKELFAGLKLAQKELSKI